MQMQIGPFRFDVATGTEYAELKRHARRRWLARERFGQPPALEDLGRDAETITVRGTVWVRAAADLAETERTLRADGAPTRVDFTVTLQEAAP